jgi:hypothetical protein
MRTSRLSLLVAAALAVMGGLTGCNERLDDPIEGEGILSIEKIDPATVKADITATDPNGQPTPLTNDDITVTLKNRPRSESAASSGLTDIFIEKADRVCSFGGGTIATGVGAGGVTVPANGSATVTTTAVTAAEKMLSGALGDTWICELQFSGHDLSGNPVTSEIVGFSVNFVDK